MQVAGEVAGVPTLNVGMRILSVRDFARFAAKNWTNSRRAAPRTTDRHSEISMADKRAPQRGAGSLQHRSQAACFSSGRDNFDARHDFLAQLQLTLSLCFSHLPMHRPKIAQRTTPPHARLSFDFPKFRNTQRRSAVIEFFCAGESMPRKTLVPKGAKR